jgi:hypothetical protein
LAPRKARRPTSSTSLKKEINFGLAAPKMKARMVKLSATALRGSAAGFGKLIAEDRKVAKVIKLRNIKLD